MAARAPKYVSIGTQTNKAQAVVRYEIASAVYLAHAVIKQDTGWDMSTLMIQARGGSVLSAGTHSDGCAIDYRVWGMSKTTRWRIVALFRECGFSASWSRDWAGNYHLHIGADTQGMFTSKVSYQVSAARLRFDGLGRGGRGGRDPHPAPSAWRNVRQGAAWAQNRLRPTHKPVPGLPGTGAGGTSRPGTNTPSRPTIPQGELTVAQINDLMTALAVQNKMLLEIQEQNRSIHRDTAGGDAQRAAAERVANVTINREGGKVRTPWIQESANQTKTLAAITGRLDGLTAALKGITAGTGVDLDAVEAAARRGAEKALRDNPVVTTTTIGGKAS